MLALSRLHQEWIIAILAAVAVWIIGRWALRRMVRSLVGQFEAQRPRAQPLTFVDNLRKQFFNNPFAVMKLLWSDERNGYALKLWRDAGPVAARAEQERTALVSSALENPLAGRGHLSVQTHDLPVDELKVHRMHLPDGRPIAVVTLPPPEHDREPYLIGLILPADPRLESDLLRARRSGEMFILNRGGGGDTQRRTDLCGWRADGRELTYNIGAPIDPEGFVLAIADKLVELKR